MQIAKLVAVRRQQGYDLRDAIYAIYQRQSLWFHCSVLAKWLCSMISSDFIAVEYGDGIVARSRCACTGDVLDMKEHRLANDFGSVLLMAKVFLHTFCFVLTNLKDTCPT